MSCFRKEIPTDLSTQWRPRKLVDVDKRYQQYDFIPMTIGERHVLEATPNGNCIYNAVSIALSGNEKLAMMLRLLSVIAVTDHLVDLSKYLHEEYQEYASIWCITSTPATPENIENSLRDQLFSILNHPYKDGSILNLLLLCHFLSRPIQQHCVSEHHSEHRQLLHPQLTDVKHPAAIHLVWVPTRPKNRYATFSHVVPTVCNPGVYGTDSDECTFAGLGICAVTYGFNCHITKPHWVCCSLCDQWLHTVCLDIPEAMFKGRQFACGCDVITQEGKCGIKSIEFYHHLGDADLEEINFKDILEGLPDSLRTSVFKKPGNTRLKFELRRRLGPFKEDFIHSINMKLRELVGDEEIRLVPDIYMPEVLLRIVMRQEEVNRLIAEKILMDEHV